MRLQAGRCGLRDAGDRRADGGGVKACAAGGEGLPAPRLLSRSPADRLAAAQPRQAQPRLPVQTRAAAASRHGQRDRGAQPAEVAQAHRHRHRHAPVLLGAKAPAAHGLHSGRSSRAAIGLGEARLGVALAGGGGQRPLHRRVVAALPRIHEAHRRRTPVSARLHLRAPRQGAADGDGEHEQCGEPRPGNRRRGLPPRRGRRAARLIGCWRAAPNLPVGLPRRAADDRESWQVVVRGLPGSCQRAALLEPEPRAALSDCSRRQATRLLGTFTPLRTVFVSPARSV